MSTPPTRKNLLPAAVCSGSQSRVFSIHAESNSYPVHYILHIVLSCLTWIPSINLDWRNRGFEGEQYYESEYEH